MRKLLAWFLRLGGLFNNPRRERELSDELESHLHLHIEDNLRRGMNSEEARRQAVIKLGGIDQAKEIYRDRRGIPMIETLIQDLRFGARMLAKNPGFTAVAVLTLALGIGANTAIFSVVNAALIRPLPYPNANRLVMVWETKLRDQLTQNVTSPATFLNWQEQNTVFEQMAAFFNDTAAVTGSDSPEQLSLQGVTPNLFAMLGVNAALGRTFQAPQDGVAGADKIALLSFEFWQRRFGADPKILGSKIMLDGESRTVVGVMPRGFHFFIKEGSFGQKQPELWIPMAFTPQSRARHGRYLQAFALLRAGVILPQAQSAMKILAAGLEAQDPASMNGWSVNLVPLRTQLVGEIEPALRILLGAVVLVLLIACANVATLLMARAESRKREIALRMALGAGRRQVILQILTESSLLAAFGGAAGLLLAGWSVKALLALAPKNLIPLEGLHIDLRVLLFTAGVALVTGLLFGMMPALQASRTQLNDPIKAGGRGLHGGSQAGWARNVFVVVEMALALVLLAGSGLLIRSFAHLLAVDPGFRPRGILTARVELSNSKYGKEEQKSEFFAQLLERIRQVPGVRSASADAFLPFTGVIAGTGANIAGRTPLPPSEQPTIDVALVEPHFFETMGIPVLRGRSFTDREARELSHKVIISQSMAMKLWPNEDPIGKGVTIYMKRENTPSEVIGVVGDVKHAGLDSGAHPTAYWAHPELAFPFMTLVVRTDGDPLTLAPAIQQAVRDLDKDQPVADILPMEDLLSASVARARFTTVILGVFAGIALLLAVIGIYGVVSYTVGERTQEIGIRMALGAQPHDMLRMVLQRGLALAAAGVMIGIAAAVAVTRLMSSLLFGTTATDPLTFASVAAMVIASALAASYVPARRATKVDPMVALRYE